MLDRVIRLALGNRLLTGALALVAVVWGLRIIGEMPIDVFPDLNRPMVTIMSEAGGLAPEEVEALVVRPVETAMNGLPGVTRVRSSSGIGLGVVWVEFDWGTNLLVNRQMVAEKLATLDQALPAGIVPVMGPISSLMGEIMLVGLTSPKMDPMELRALADWILRPRVQALSGVAQVIPIGGGVKQIQIVVDPRKLKEFGITLEQVQTAASNIGMNTTGSFVEGEHQEYLIRNVGRPRSIDEIADTTIVRTGGVSITLRDVGRVVEAPQFKRGDAGINARPAVIMGIQKQPNVNTVELTRRLETELASLQKALPHGVKLHILFKQATFIETAIDNVEAALRDGSIFVAIILFLFLMNFRTTLITLTAIPLSLVVTFIVLKMFGVTINTMTLGGLAVAIGELVDDAIVDVENVFRRLKENRAAGSPKASLRVVYEASSEVRKSIVFATVIVVLVFIPLFALEGLEGRLFIPLGIAYVVSILASLIVSLTVTPVLCSVLLPEAPVTAEVGDSRFVAWLKGHDQRILEHVLDRPRKVGKICAGLVGMAAISFFLMGQEFLPPFNEGTVTAFVVTPPGTSLRESSRLAVIAEKQFLKIPGIHATARRSGRAELDEHAEGVFNSEIDVDLNRAGGSRDEILGKMREALKEIPGIGMSLGQPISHRLDAMLSGVKAQIAIKIFGEDLSVLGSLARDIQGKISRVEGLVDAEVEKVTLVPQIQIIPDPARAKRYGLSVGFLTKWLEEALSGAVVGEVVDGQRRMAVVIRVDESAKSDLHALENLYVDVPGGGKIPLYAVATVQQTTGPNGINHENSKRRIVVMANTQGRDLGSVVADVKEILDHDVKLPEGYFIGMDGQFENQQRAMARIVMLAFFSLIGIFLVLYIHFQSTFFASQVMLSLPLAFFGGMLAVMLTGGVFSVGTLIGFVTLCGIASRNGIMMISHYLHLMTHEGYSFGRDLVIRGSLERLVPVMMTALTASLALVPLALAGNEPGKEILHPVAVVILGGLISSTLLDIIVTPTVFFNYGRASAEAAVARYRNQSQEKEVW